MTALDTSLTDGLGEPIIGSEISGRTPGGGLTHRVGSLQDQVDDLLAEDALAG